jgi:hypothetical protein
MRKAYKISIRPKDGKRKDEVTRYVKWDSRQYDYFSQRIGTEIGGFVISHIKELEDEQ